MELKIVRVEKTLNSTIGRFYVNGIQLGWTLEDRDRGLKSSMSLNEIKAIKIKGETAIPKGRYEVILTVSEKFKDRTWAKPYGGRVPLICNIPGYSGVLLHVGNGPEDTLGCPLVAMEVDKTKSDRVIRSTEAYHELMLRHLLPAWDRHELIYITVE